MQKSEQIEIRGARQHNLKNINLDIPLQSLTVITGLSGSGKSSLAFDTLYAEGQRRYVESLSAYARQFLGVMGKPDVDSIRGLSPAIAIQQKKLSNNPRSTVGTVTEIYDYLRLLFAHVGTPFCPNCAKVIRPQDVQSMVKHIIKEYAGTRIQICAPIIRGKKGSYDYLFEQLKKQGYTRVRVDGVVYNLHTESILLRRYAQHTIEVVIDRIDIHKDEQQRIAEALEAGLKEGGGFVLLLITKKEGEKKIEERMLSKHKACVDCGINFPEMSPRMFSFNAPQGACQECHGLGAIQEFDEELIIPDTSKSILDGGVAPWKSSTLWVPRSTLRAISKHYHIDITMPIKSIPRDAIRVILWGDDESGYEGVIPQLKRMYAKTDSDERREGIGRYLKHTECPSCKGKRLRSESLSVKIDAKSIIDVTDLPIKECSDFLFSLELTEAQKKIAHQVLKEIQNRLTFLLNVGLEYLTLGRMAGTLSGGEAQRIHLATQIGSELRGVLYILDEPSIGLHQRDNAKLIATLKGLRDIGNTVIVVEHDEETMRASDHIIDIGPGAGMHGGSIVGQGSIKEIIRSKKSLTGSYLSGKSSIPLPTSRRIPRGYITVKGASGNNLKTIDAAFPLSVFACVTGVSGSGKSTLVNDTLYNGISKHFGFSPEAIAPCNRIEGLNQIDKAIIIDQDPIGRTPRSNPATYTGVFTYIRDLFTETKESKMRGYQPGRFSFNVAEGRCGNCEGDGVIKIEMHFLPDVYVTCDVCNGKRYDDETLSVTYKEKTIADVLAMSVEEALVFFKPIPRIHNKLQTLYDVGLSYIQLGQNATTLSGGEAQRIKLATELSRRDTGRTVYVLDEPTTGLHFEDIRKLLDVLNRLVEKGNTVIVIEHNLDVIKTADYIIDLGPEGGKGGGEIVAKGKPEEIARVEKSWTGTYLKHALKK
ncbi:MAG: excinuclease ABC subunit UvrA [Patescibacteria group bacterium]